MRLLDRYPVFTLTVLAGALYALGRLATSRLGVDPLVVGIAVAGVLVVAWRFSRLS